MGLSLSSRILSLNLLWHEFCQRPALHRPDSRWSTSDPESVHILRYVDYILAMSSSLCKRCLIQYLRELYPFVISVVSSSDCQDSNSVAKHRWLDFEAVVHHDNLQVKTWYANEDWLLVDQSRAKPTLATWLGRRSVDLMFLRSHFGAMCQRIALLDMSTTEQIQCLRHFVCELVRLGYPWKSIYGIVCRPRSQASSIIFRLTQSVSRSSGQ